MQTESLFAENYEYFFNGIDQKRKGSLRANVFRFALVSGHLTALMTSPLSANRVILHCEK
jgi:hypothetical protein